MCLFKYILEFGTLVETTRRVTLAAIFVLVSSFRVSFAFAITNPSPALYETAQILPRFQPDALTRQTYSRFSRTWIDRERWRGGREIGRNWIYQVISIATRRGGGRDSPDEETIVTPPQLETSEIRPVRDLTLYSEFSTIPSERRGWQKYRKQMVTNSAESLATNERRVIDRRAGCCASDRSMPRCDSRSRFSLRDK